MLGPLVVQIGGEDRAPTAPRQRALLGLFLLSPGEPIPAERILDRLWGETPPSGGVKTVGFHLSKLRDALEPDRARGTDGSLIRTTPAGYVLTVDPGSVDAVVFERLLQEARSVLAVDPGKAAALARDAIALWRGPALADFTYEDFAQHEIRRLDELRLRTLETRAEADLSLGRHADLVAELESLVTEHPLREGLRSALMLALYRSGRQADALRQFEDLRRVLAEEVGLIPSPLLQDLEGRILEQDPALDQPEWATPSASVPSEIPNPYKGLRPFTEADAADFHGRGELVRSVFERLADRRFVALVGPSGSGKSSAVRAGVLPNLPAGIRAARMVPGTRPVEELEIALVRAFPESPTAMGEVLRSGPTGLSRAVRTLVGDDLRLLLVVDQFEELWSLAPDDDRQAFIALLVEAVGDTRCPVVVLVSIRSDFLGEPLSEPSLAGAMENGVVLVPPMTAAEIETAVVRPAERAGVGVDPGLVSAVVADVADNPGALPLLQYALTEAFESRTGDVLRREDYEAVGGLRGALGRRAEEVYGGLGPGSQQLAHQLFLRLVTPGEGTGDTRRRAAVEDVENLGEDSAGVMRAFGDARLLTFDRDPISDQATVEVAHEAILTEWDRLRAWITEARDDLATQRRLHDLATEWDRSERDEDLLLSGGRLARFSDWIGTSRVAVGRTEKEFVDASVEARSREEKQTTSRRRGVIAALALAASVTTVLALVTLGQGREATSLRKAAEANLAVLQVNELALELLELKEDAPELATLLAMEAVVDAHRAGAELDGAVTALQLSMQGLKVRFPADAEVTAVAGSDRAVGAFLVPVRDLLVLASANTGRELTDEECLQYLHRQCTDGPIEGALPAAVLDDTVLDTVRELKPLAGTSVSLWFLGFDFRDPIEASWAAAVDQYTNTLGPLVRLESSTGQTGAFNLFLERFRGTDVIVTGAEPLVTEVVLDLGVERNVALEDVPELAVPLNGIVPTSLIQRATPPTMNEFLTEGARQFAVWVSFQPVTTVWYRQDVFETLQLEPPETWAELTALTATIADRGITPWCFGFAGVSGFDSIRWLVESQVMAIGGVELFDAWSEHEVPMTDPRIVEAHERAAELIFDEGAHKGLAAVMRTSTRAFTPFLSPEPECVLWNVVAPWVQEHRNEYSSVDVGVFRLPTGFIDGIAPDVVSGNVAAMLTDSPEARTLMTVLLSDGFTRRIAESASAYEYMANLGLSPVHYPDVNDRKVASEIQAAGRSDLLRPEFLLSQPDLRRAYDAGLERWLDEGPEALSDVLGEIEATWQALDDA